jgi:hypothetical protein
MENQLNLLLQREQLYRKPLNLDPIEKGETDRHADNAI